MEKKNIYQKLCYVQSKLKAPKNQYNKFGNYYYRNCEDIQEALKPLMQEIGAVLTIGDELIQVGDRFYIKATARFIDTETGEFVENTAYAREESEKKGMDVSQVTGSTSSYARKYALNGLFCIDDTKDSDALQGQPPSEPKGKPRRKTEKDVSVPPASPTPAPSSAPVAKDASRVVPFPGLEARYVNSLYMELNRTGIGLKNMLNKYKKKDIHDLTLEEYKDAMNILTKKPDKPINKEVSYSFPPDNLDETGLPWAEAT